MTTISAHTYDALREKYDELKLDVVDLLNDIERMNRQIGEYSTALLLIAGMPNDAPNPLAQCRSYANSALMNWDVAYAAIRRMAQ